MPGEKQISQIKISSAETEDSFAASLRFENGALGVVTAGTAAYPGFERRLEICGTNGSMVLLEGNLAELHVRGEAPMVRTVVQNNGAGEPFDIDYEPHRRQYKNIMAHLEKGEKLFIDGKDAARTLELIFSMYKNTEK